MSKKENLLTGIRASGEIHLGNYLGAMKPALLRQKEFYSHLFIADYHALTTTPSPEELKQNVRSVAAAWLASGLDPDESLIWKQSDVPQVLELAYILNCLTTMGLLERAHSYKDAVSKSKTIKAGIFYYPVLMAADILLYRADWVPVGKDQVQHLEMARDMATFFNEAYGETLKLPRELVEDEIATIPGTDGRKMSKSYSNGIQIFDDEKSLKKQIMGIVTDSKDLAEPKEAESCVVYQLYRLIAPKELSLEMKTKLEAGGYGYGNAKKSLFEFILDEFKEMRRSYQSLIQDPSTIDHILTQGAKRAGQKADEMIEEVRKKVGL